MAAGLVHLALKWPQLTANLTLDVLGTYEVLLHRLELSLGALLAPAML